MRVRNKIMLAAIPAGILAVNFAAYWYSTRDQRTVDDLPPSMLMPEEGQGLALGADYDAALEIEADSRLAPVTPADNAIHNANALLASGRCEEALIAFRKAHLDFPNVPNTKRALVEGLVECARRSVNKGEADLAARWLEEALRLRPTQSDALFLLGKVYARIDRIPESIEVLNRYLKVRDDDISAHHFLGGLYYQAGDLTKAESHLVRGNQLPDRTRRLLDVTQKRLEVEGHFWTTESGHFRIKYDAERYHDVAVRILGILEAAHRYVGDHLGYFPEDTPTIVLYTREAFQDITRTPKWTGAIFDGEIRLPIGGMEDPNQIDRIARMLFHEYTHVVVFQMARKRCPTWINEGLAQAVEVGFEFPDQLLGGTPLPLEDLQTTFLKIQETAVATIAYRQSLDMVRMLIEDFGLSYMRDYLLALREPIPTDAAFERVFRVSPEAFFKRWLERRYGTP